MELVVLLAVVRMDNSQLIAPLLTDSTHTQKPVRITVDHVVPPLEHLARTEVPTMSAELATTNILEYVRIIADLAVT